jgi:protein-tyrosine phosphatase
MEIVFVCTGNLCRSPMAEGLFREMLRQEGLDEDVRVSSAGTHAWDGLPVSDPVHEVLEPLEIEVIRHRSRFLTEGICREADLLVVMEPRHGALILGSYANYGEKIRFLAEYDLNNQQQIIEDPYGEMTDAYYRAFEQIQRALPGLLEEVKGLLEQGRES